MSQEEEQKKTIKSTDNEELRAKFHHAPLHVEKPRDQYFKIRNLLNIIFMLLAAIGLIIMYATDMYQTGVRIVLAAVAVKIIEVGLRMFKR